MRLNHFLLACSAATALAACGGGGAFVAGPDCTSAPAAVSWTRQTAAAPWQARDSAAEVVVGDRMWLMGGWFDSFAPTPRDVWSSADGINWQEVTPQAPWTAGDLSAATSFAGRLWLLSGWSGGRLAGAHASNEVWSSPDGLSWELAGNAPWSARVGAAAVEFRGRLWILGGVESYYYGDASSLKNDVWSSPDGVQWTQSTAAAPWAPRAYHQSFVFADRLWVVGGGNYLPGYAAYNDVWSSPDGVQWTQVSASTPWSPRIWFSAAVYRGAMWVVGGWSNDPYQNWGDVWYSTDGRHWARLDSVSAWPARHESSVYVFRDRLWVAGGFAEPVVNDVWSLALPADWLPACSATGQAG